MITHNLSKDNNCYYMYTIFEFNQQNSAYMEFLQISKDKNKRTKLITLKTKEASLKALFPGAVFQ